MGRVSIDQRVEGGCRIELQLNRLLGDARDISRRPPSASRIRVSCQLNSGVSSSS